MEIPRGRYLKNLLISVDQFVNSLFGGYCDETISSRAYRWEQSGKRSWTRKMIDAIFFWEERHCYSSYISEREGRQLPPELR